ncbi:NAD(P)H-quinone oxidoreductase subunit 4 [compost metagenome]
MPIGSLGVVSIDYALAIDGISFPLVLLAVVVLFVGVISSWNINHKARGYFALYLLLSGDSREAAPNVSQSSKETN